MRGCKTQSTCLNRNSMTQVALLTTELWHGTQPSRSRTVFLSQYPDLTVSIPDPLSLMGESEGGGKSRYGKRETHTHRGRHIHSRTMVSLLINWKRTSTPPSSVQTYGVIRTTLLHCHNHPLSSSKSSLPLTPARKPFNQSPREYMDMIQEKKEGKKEGGKRDTASPLVKQTQ